MNFKKTAISAAVTAVMAAAIATPVNAAQLSMDYTGLFTMRDATGKKIANSSNPYYSDPTWGNGTRTPISGTLDFDTTTGAGSGTVNPFDFFSGGPAVASGVLFQSVGGGLMVGNMNFAWNGSNITTNIVLDGSGLFNALGALGLPPVSTTLDSAACTGLALGCATAATDGVSKGAFSMGPIPIATSTLNVQGDTGFGTTLGDLLAAWTGGVDDGIGGSPMSNGPFAGSNANFDITSIHVTAVVPDAPPAVPVPAAVWLFGSGLIGLVGVARRRKHS